VDVANAIKDKYLFNRQIDNHNVPQYIYILDQNRKPLKNIKVLHTETLNDEMKQMGYTDFNLYEKRGHANRKNYRDYLNEESIQIINKYYHYDFVCFGYKKIEIGISQPSIELATSN